MKTKIGLVDPSNVKSGNQLTIHVIVNLFIINNRKSQIFFGP